MTIQNVQVSIDGVFADGQGYSPTHLLTYSPTRLLTHSLTHSQVMLH
jgi:hypothetical protein